jgi:hypothetical protein
MHVLALLIRVELTQVPCPEVCASSKSMNIGIVDSISPACGYTVGATNSDCLRNRLDKLSVRQCNCALALVYRA